MILLPTAYLTLIAKAEQNQGFAKCSSLCFSLEHRNGGVTSINHYKNVKCLDVLCFWTMNKQ